MARPEDSEVLEARDIERRKERKNYTYRLPIYLAELFSKVCEQKAISPVTLVEKWIGEYVEPFEGKFGPDVLSGIDKIIESKKQGELKSRQKQKRKRG